MSDINCNCMNCMYNMRYKCYKKNISIQGLLASNSDNTYCESFNEGENVYEFADYDDFNQIVYCNALNCRHLSSGICKAKEINISGGKIKSKSESICKTFKQE